MTRHRLFALPLLVVLLGAVVLAARGTGPQGEQYDLVLMGGRVLDPETGLDAKRNVGIRDGRIAAVTVEPLAARETLAVAGLVVAPGFIDLHAHAQASARYRHYAHDGVSLVERGLGAGALGIGFGIAYTPGASREEILRVFRVAARHGVPCFVHLREGGRDPATGGSVAGLQEVIADAAATGASLHVV